MTLLTEVEDNLARSCRITAYQLRRQILTAAYKGNGGHLGGAFSCIDALTVLYTTILRHDPERPEDPDRDRFIFSKGHSSLALYFALAHAGYFPVELLDSYGQEGAAVAGHPERGKLPGIEISTGALGHGPPIGVGIALAGRLNGRSYRTFVLVGDGESNEGSVWEALLAAAQLRLDRFCLVVDNNGLESLDRTQNILGLEPLAAKLESFGCEVEEIDGHDFTALIKAFRRTERPGDGPRAIILNTDKGHGVDFMTNVTKWHYRGPSAEEYAEAMRQLEAVIHA